MSYYLIDPNKEILKNGNDITGNNQMPEYERYNIYAELLVLTKDNAEIKFDEKGNLLNFETTKGLRINLLGANANNQFTTNYTDTILGNRDTTAEIEEGIGIRNITITINDKYVPKVTIEMVDVRGSVIFNIENSKYKGFFDFPPPLFVLRAKAHYGKPIQMTLQKLKHNIKFDSSSGNYIITAEFIGYAFAPLADVPFAYAKTINMMVQKEKYSVNVNNLNSENIDTFNLIQRARTLYTDLKVLKDSKLSKEINDLTSDIEVLKGYVSLETDTQILSIPSIKDLSVPKTLQNDRIILSISGLTNTDRTTLLDNIRVELTTFNPEEKFNVKPIYSYETNNEIVIDYRRYDSSLKSVYNEKLDLLTEKQNAFEKEKNNITKNTLGFEPTVKNVLDIIINDTELYLKELKNSAQSQPKTLNSNPNVLKNNTIDRYVGYPTVIENVVENGNTFEKLIFPGVKQEFSQWGEVKFVNEFITRYRQGRTIEDTIKNNSFISTDEAGNKKWLPMNAKDCSENSEINSTFNPYIELKSADDILAYSIKRLLVNYNHTYNEMLIDSNLKYIGFNKTDPKGILNTLGSVEAVNLMNGTPLTKSQFTNLQVIKNLLTDVTGYKTFLQKITDNKQKYPNTYELLTSRELPNVEVNNVQYIPYNDKSNFNGILKLSSEEPKIRPESTNDTFVDDFITISEGGFFYEALRGQDKSLTDTNLLLIKDSKYNEEAENERQFDSDFLAENEYSSIAIWYKWNFDKLNTITNTTDFFYFLAPNWLERKLSTPSIIGIPLIYLDYIRKNNNNFNLSNADLNLINSYLDNNENLVKANEEFNKLKSEWATYLGINTDIKTITSSVIENFFSKSSSAYNSFKNLNRLGLEPTYLYNTSNNTFFKNPANKPQPSFSGVSDMYNAYDDDEDNPISAYFNSFKSKYNSLYKTKEEEFKSTEQTYTQSLEEREEIQLECYKSFKRIYDRWLVGEQAQMDLTNTDSIKNMFKYINRNYTDASNIIISLEPLLSFDLNNEVSVYSVIAKLLEENNFSFFPLQTFIDINSQNKDVFAENFRIYDKFSLGDFPPPAFICMYIGGYSENNNLYTTDGVNTKYEYADFGKSDLESDKLGMQVPADFQTQSGNTNIPIFLINYGQQNQSVFKSFDFDTSEFKETNESIKYLDLLYANKDKSAPVPKANNLLNIYGARAYSTTVNMIGNLTIQPTMYCQINHVPLYNGGYIILNVEHSITPNKVDTKFKCTRIPLFITPPVTTSSMKGLSDNDQISNVTITDGNTSLYTLTPKEKELFFEGRESINTPEKAGSPDVVYFKVGATIKDINITPTENVLKKLKSTISKRVLKKEKETLKASSTPNTYKFANLLGRSESTNNYNAVSANGDFYGRYQIGQSLIKDAFSPNNYLAVKKLLINNSAKTKIDKYYNTYIKTKKIDMSGLMFDNDAQLEKKVQDTLFLMCLRVNYNYLFNEYKSDISPLFSASRGNVLGIEPSKMGLLAATWLTGIGTVRKFAMDANKNFKPKIMIGVDGNLTPLTVYLEFITLGKSFDITVSEINNLLATQNIDIPVLI